MPFRDFDAGRKARRPLQFVFDGKPHLLPGSPSATKVIAFMNYDRATGTGDQARLLLEDLFDGKIAELQKAGMDWATLNELEAWALAEWGLGPPLQKPIGERIQAVNAELASIVDQGEREGVFPPDLAASVRGLHDALLKLAPPVEAADDADPKSSSATSSAGGDSS